MDGHDLHRRVGWQRSDARMRLQLDPLRRRPAPPAATAADCVKLGAEPFRRFDALRRSQGLAAEPRRGR